MTTLIYVNFGFPSFGFCLCWFLYIYFFIIIMDIIIISRPFFPQYFHLSLEESGQSSFDCNLILVAFSFVEIKPWLPSFSQSLESECCNYSRIPPYNHLLTKLNSGIVATFCWPKETLSVLVVGLTGFNCR